MNVVWIGLVTVAVGALLGLLQQRWSLLAVLIVALGIGLGGYGYLAQKAKPQVIEEKVLASDENQPSRPEAAAPEGESKPKAREQTAAEASGNAPSKEPAEEVTPAPDIPEHVIPGKLQPWVKDLANLVAKPNHYPLTQSGPAPEDAPNKGDRVYEYVNVKLGGRAFQTVFLSKSPTDPNMWMVHVEPGAQSPPIQPEELGDARILGEGGNFIVFQLESGPFAGDYLVWASGGHRGGGEAVRIYSPPFLKREHGLAQQIAAAAGKKP